MIDAINAGLASFITDLTQVATVALPIGAAALLVCGFRLAAKLTNRGVGK